MASKAATASRGTASAALRQKVSQNRQGQLRHSARLQEQALAQCSQEQQQDKDRAAGAAAGSDPQPDGTAGGGSGRRRDQDMPYTHAHSNPLYTAPSQPATQPEEADTAATVAALQAQVAALTSELQAVKAQLGAGAAAGAAATGVQEAADEDTLATMQAQTQQLKEALAQSQQQFQQLQQQLQEIRQMQATINAASSTVAACVAAAGMHTVESAQGLRDAADKGAAAHTQQGQVQEKLAAVEQAGADCRAEQRRLERAMLDAVRQLQGAHGTIVVRAPAAMTADEVQKALVAAGQCSGSSVQSVHRLGAQPASGAASDGAAGSGSGAAGGSGGGSTDGGGTGSGDGSSRSGKQTWLVSLSSKRLEGYVLGGVVRCRLRDSGVPIYVDCFLSKEQLQERQKARDFTRQLQREGVKWRWQGTLLQCLQRGTEGRAVWVPALPPPPGSPGRQQQPQRQQHTPRQSLPQQLDGF